MSNAHVKLNGREVAYWPYGYNSFYTDVTDAILPGKNEIVVELENYERASRWYPGAGLYRNVHVVNTDKIHIPTWGTYVTTPFVSPEEASVRLEMEITGAGKGEKIGVRTEIISPEGKVVACNDASYVAHGQNYSQNFLISQPELWNPENPCLYTARTILEKDGKVVDPMTQDSESASSTISPKRDFSLTATLPNSKVSAIIMTSVHLEQL